MSHDLYRHAILLHYAKFLSYNSLRSWDITISGFEKQTFAILEFYFRFRFRPYHCQVILRQAVKFHPNRTILSGDTICYIKYTRSDDLVYLVISIFKMAPAATQFYFRFRIGWRRLLNIEKLLFYDSISKPNFLVITQLKYNYVRLGKTKPVILEFYFRFLFWPHHPLNWIFQFNASALRGNWE